MLSGNDRGKAAMERHLNATFQTQIIGCCPVDGEWTQFSPPSICLQPFDSPHHFRQTRQCVGQRCGGDPCEGVSEILTFECCVSRGVPDFGEWSMWGSALCGSQTRSRFQECTPPRLSSPCEEAFSCENLIAQVRIFVVNFSHERLYVE